MSRNLCSTRCYYCGFEPVRLEETPRPITSDEAFVYFEEYAGMLVANAVCPLCEAKYLAWCDETTRINKRWQSYHHGPTDGGYFDLSFRSTFNDEPGPDDKPKYRIKTEVTYTREPWVDDHWGQQ